MCGGAACSSEPLPLGKADHNINGKQKKTGRRTAMAQKS